MANNRSHQVGPLGNFRIATYVKEITTIKRVYLHFISLLDKFSFILIFG